MTNVPSIVARALASWNEQQEFARIKAREDAALVALYDLRCTTGGCTPEQIVDYMRREYGIKIPAEQLRAYVGAARERISKNKQSNDKEETTNG